MKKAVYVFFAFCILFLSVIEYQAYSNVVYNAIIGNKREVMIEEKNEQSNVDFLNDLQRISIETGKGIIFKKSEDISQLKVIFNIYTTTLSKDFIDLPNNYDSDTIRENDVLTTEKNESGYQIYGMNSEIEYRFHPFAEAAQYPIHRCLFYIDSEDDSMLNALKAAGYDVFIQNYQDSGNLNITFSDSGFIIVTLFFFISSLFYVFTTRRNIAIKSIHGYKRTNIFFSTFINNIFIFFTITIFILIGTGLLYFIKYGKTALYFVKHSLLYYALYFAVCMVLFIAACIMHLKLISPNDIRKLPVIKWQFGITYVMHLSAVIALTYGIAFSFYMINEYNITQKAVESWSDYFDLHTLSISVASENIDISDKDNTRYLDFINDLESSHSTFLCDKTMLEYDGVLSVNAEYFDYSPIYKENGEAFTQKELKELEKDNNVMMVPASLRKDIEEEGSTESQQKDEREDEHEHEHEHEHAHAHEEEYIDTQVVYYSDNQSFPLLNTLYSQNNGSVTNPIIYLTPLSALEQTALSLISSQSIIFKANTESAYNEIYPLLKKHNLDTVIVESPTMKEIFDIDLYYNATGITYYVTIGIMYLVCMVLLCFLETIIYIETFKRTITIRFLHGYGVNAYRLMAVLKIFSFIVAIVASFIFQVPVVLSLTLFIFDMLLFVYLLSRIQYKHMISYLKGDL